MPAVSRALRPAFCMSRVLVFNIGVTLYIGEKTMAVTGIFTYVLPLALITAGIARRTNRYSRQELAAHLEDYPWSAAGS